MMMLERNSGLCCSSKIFPFSRRQVCLQSVTNGFPDIIPLSLPPFAVCATLFPKVISLSLSLSVQRQGTRSSIRHSKRLLWQRGSRCCRYIAAAPKCCVSPSYTASPRPSPPKESKRERITHKGQIWGQFRRSKSFCNGGEKREGVSFGKLRVFTWRCYYLVLYY